MRLDGALVRHGLSYAFGLVGLLALVSALIDLRSGADVTLRLLGCAAVLGGLAVVSGLGRERPRPGRSPLASVLAAALIVWAGLIVAGAFVYLVTGTFGRVDDALFESTAGFTTTAHTLLDDPGALPRGVLVWRAGTQWVGGLAVLWLVVVVPLSLLSGELGSRQSVADLASQRTAASLRRVTIIYGLLSVVAAVLFAVAGTGVVDALMMAASTVSLGGFSPRAGSLAGFDSEVVEWLTIAVMVVAGANLAGVGASVAHHGARGLAVSWRARAYAGVLVGGAVATALADRGRLSLRESVLGSVSATTTGGFGTVAWSETPAGGRGLLVVLVGLGGLAGTVSGGFGLQRARILFGMMRRELTRHLYPHSVVVVRTGRHVVGEAEVMQLVALSGLWVTTVFGGGVLLGATTPLDISEVLSGAISTLSTHGPALGAFAPGAGASELPRPGRGVVAALMVCGRLTFFPLVFGVIAVFGSARRTIVGARR